MKKTVQNKQNKTNKIAALYPSMREKKRYVVFEVISDHNSNNHPVSMQKVYVAIKSGLQKYLGTLHYAQAQVMFLPQLSSQNNGTIKGVIRIDHAYDHQLRACFCLIDEIEKTKVIIRSILSTGVIDKAKKSL